MKNKNIKLNIKYSMNFSPKYLNSQIKLSKNKLNKIYCRNFIFTVLIFDLLKSNQIKNINSIYPFKYSFFLLKDRKHYGSHLRAPYKNKSTQFSLGIVRYYLLVSFTINNYRLLNINSINDFITLSKFLSSYNYFESSLVTQVNRNINVPINVKLL